MGLGRLRLGAIALGLIAIVAAAAATTATGSSARAGALPDTVTMRLNQDYPSFDAQVDLARPQAFSVTGPLYDRLVTLAADGKSYVPYLASSWVQKANRITFTIRSGVAKCSTDGHALTALDVLNSFKRHILTPKRSGSVATAGIGGWGAGPYHIHADVKRSTFTLSVDHPYRNLLTPFASLPIICPAGLDALKSNPRALEDAAYGSGPYTLVSAKHGDRIEYKVRPEWNWGPKGALTGKELPKTLVIQVVADDTTAANLLLTGGLDIAEITGPDVDRLLATPLHHKEVKNYYTDDLAFNQRPGRPLSGPEAKPLRLAISTAVDPKLWNQASNAGHGEVATGWFRKGTECYDPSIAKLMPTPSIDRAKQILTQAGYTYSGTKLLKDGKQVALDLLTTPLANQGPDYLLATLTQLGIDVTPRNQPGSVYGTNFLNGNFDMTIVRGSQSNFDAGLNVAPKFGDVAFNTAWAGYGDAEFNRLVSAANQNPGQGGCKYFSLVQKKALENAYNLPMAARNFEIFSRGIETASQSTGSVFPSFWFKAVK
jgi:peptide/nickel transport system substrate-binding protein